MTLLKNHRWLVVICLFFLTSGFLRLNDLSLYTDSTRYLIWGTSFAHMKEFVDETQPEPDRYVVNAPLYAVLISPPLIFFPFSVFAAKIWTVFWACCALVLFYILLSRKLEKSWAILGTFIFVVNPLNLVISTEVLSEAPFLTFLFLIFILIDEFCQSSAVSKKMLWPLLVCTGLVVVLREVAVTLIAAVVISFLLQKKPKYALSVLASAAVVYALWLLRNLVLVGENPSAQSSNIYFVFQHALTPSNAPFSEEILARVRSNISDFGIQLGGMLLFPFPPNLIIDPGSVFRFFVSVLGSGKYVIVVITLGLMMAGIVLDLKKSPSALIRFLFALAYLALILAYPIHDIRFLLPVLPLLILYLMTALAEISDKMRAGGNLLIRRILILIVVVSMIPNVVFTYEILRTNLSYRTAPLDFYNKTQQTSPDKTHFSTPWEMMGTWIREKTPETAVIASSAKEIATFVGGRKTLEINSGVPLPIFEFLLRDQAADYVLATGLWSDLFSYEFLMRESSRFWFEPVVQIANLRLFKIHSRYLNLYNSPKHTFEFDTATATGLLRRGRLELITEKYREARYSLERALVLQPNQPELMFQLFLACTFLGDSSDAIQQIRQMFTKPRSTPFVWAAQLHLKAMNDLSRLKSVENEALRSTRLFDVARLYWNLGYRRQSYRIMRQAVQVDSSYFVGLLWSWHYGIQVGDTTGARSSLRKLQTIDTSNAVVKSFTVMTRLSDTLGRTKIPRERSRLRLLIAQQYEKMELPEESVDEAERSSGEDPANIQAWAYLQKMFDVKQKERAAKKATERILQLDPSNVAAKKRLTEKI